MGPSDGGRRDAAQGPSSSAKRFPGERYLSLESYRKSGEGVRTTVWFVEADGVCYIRTHSNSWKAKRMRVNPKVKLSPSSFLGRAKGEWVDAQAGVTSVEGEKKSVDLFNKKYGVQKRATDLFSWLMRRRYVSFTLNF